MESIKILEQLAHNTHFQKENNELINCLSIEIKNAYLNNDIGFLKKQFSQHESYANEIAVVHLKKCL